MDLVPWSDVGLLPFLALTFVIGGATAWATGRAVAGTWRPLSQVFIYMIGVSGAVRFLHYALFDGYFISPSEFLNGAWRWAIAYVALAAIGALGYQLRRSAQMATQYSWLGGDRR